MSKEAKQAVVDELLELQAIQKTVREYEDTLYTAKKENKPYSLLRCALSIAVERGLEQHEKAKAVYLVWEEAEMASLSESSLRLLDTVLSKLNEAFLFLRGTLYRYDLVSPVEDVFAGSELDQELLQSKTFEYRKALYQVKQELSQIRKTN